VATIHEAARQAGFASSHALPMRLRRDVIGAMNLFCTSTTPLSERDLARGKALTDVATIGLLQERSVRQKEVLAEQLQGALNSRILIEQAKGVLAERDQLCMTEAFTAMRSHARNHGQPLNAIATAVIDGTLDSAALQSR